MLSLTAPSRRLVNRIHRIGLPCFVVLLNFHLLRGADGPPLSDPNYTGPSAPTVDLPSIVLPLSKPFAHPGLLQSQSNIDFIRARLAAREEPWTSALQAMLADPYCAPTYRALVIPEIDPHGSSAGYLMKDSSAAYGNALLWCITGKREYAEKAIELLNANSYTLRAILPGRKDQSKITAGFTAGKFALAAELLAHYKQPDGSTANWKPEDIARCKAMLTMIFYPLIENFKPEFNGNWDAAMVSSMLCIGVFCDDHEKFNRALNYYLRGEGHGSISHYIHRNGQTQESARDQTHTQLGLGSLAAACEIAWKQGIDLYAVAENRLAAGIEYTAKYGLGYEVETVDEIPISAHGRGRYMPIFEVAYQHYAIEKGLPMPYTKQVLEKQRPEGMDLIVLQAWGTLTNYRGPATGRAQIPQTTAPAPSLVK